MDIHLKSFRQNLIFRAFKILKNMRDAQDAVQDAYLVYYTYFDRMREPNKEKLMNFYVTQRAIALLKKRYYTNFDVKVKKSINFSEIQDSLKLKKDTNLEEVICNLGKYYETPDFEEDLEYDDEDVVQIILKNDLKIPFYEKLLSLTDHVKVTKYGDYHYIRLSSGRGGKYKEQVVRKFKRI